MMNEAITFPEVRLLGPDGKSHGIVTIEEAWKVADDFNMDIIVVSKDANPPVCKIMDYGHYKYEKEKQLKQSRKGSKATVIKELKMSPKISEHDYQVRFRAAQKFLGKGNKVKVTVNFRGREMAHLDLGKDLLDRFLNELSDVAVADNQPKLEGRRMILMLSAK